MENILQNNISPFLFDHKLIPEIWFQGLACGRIKTDSLFPPINQPLLVSSSWLNSHCLIIFYQNFLRYLIFFTSHTTQIWGPWLILHILFSRYILSVVPSFSMNFHHSSLFYSPWTIFVTHLAYCFF